MEAIYLFILLLIGLTGVLGIILGDSSRTDVVSHWSERRCDLDVLISAFMYKPSDDTRGSLQFSSDNFNFCIGSKTTDYLNTIFGALFELMRKQMGVADIMGQVMKMLRVQLNSIYAPFAKMITIFWNKFKQIGSLSSRIFQHLYMSMKKAAGVGIASTYLAISLQMSIFNMIDLAILVISIVLGILMALAIIFFIPIIPMIVIVTLTGIALSELASGISSPSNASNTTGFCFSPDTRIIMNDYTTKKICQIQLGDILLSGQKVEATIEVPGSDAIIYSVDGILVSSDHRIWNVARQEWILVKDDPAATKTDLMLPTLWTLITSSRQIPIMSDNDALLFSDWEEIPDSHKASLGWDLLVRDILNKDTHSKPIHVPEHAPCFDRSIRVKKYQAGWVPISSIQRNDWIMDSARARWTRVLGVCQREVGGGYGEKGYRMTDGVWIKTAGANWQHPTAECDGYVWQGSNLITDSGAFNILLSDSSEFTVRDFTEVGWMNLPKTYTRVGAMMA
jgi:hypothetical protein